MYLFLKHSALFLLAGTFLFSSAAPRPYETSDANQSTPIPFSMVISGGVSLGAYEAGYNWALIKILSEIKEKNRRLDPDLKSVAGASAGSINALLTAVYWCQKESIPYENGIKDNLFYETWVHLGLEDLVIRGEDPHNKSTLFSRRALRKKAAKIMKHMGKHIFRESCEVPMGFAVTKVTPVIETFQGIEIKNQMFSVPLMFKVSGGKAMIENIQMPPSTAFYISIPGIDTDYRKVTDVLFASSAFPGAFQQVKLNYAYKGKHYSQYFIDGGAYNNVPLQLATELNQEAHLFIYMDPGHIRKLPKHHTFRNKEKPPVGFLNANISPLTSAVEIYQQMNLYQAINLYFRNHPERKLVLSSRYHPLTAGFLDHFGAFLDLNFRIYDYYVGVYDAIYNIADRLKKRGDFPRISQKQLMDHLMKRLHIDKNKEAYTAYRFFKATEFKDAKIEKNNRYAAIYYAFNLKAPESKRYDTAEFTKFLSRLDMRYLPVRKKSFLAQARKDVKNWAKRPLRILINRITTLENDKAKASPGYTPLSKSISIAAWGVSSLVKEKDGWDPFPLNAPRDKGKEGLRTALRILPSEVAIDAVNGGMSLGYDIYWYKNMKYLNGIEIKPSYNFNEDQGDFVRLDVNAFYEYGDFVKFGAGISGFGNVERKFYDKDSAYGGNLYIDIMDIFRMTYVRRHGQIEDNAYFYLGIENIPSLLYWLNR